MKVRYCHLADAVNLCGDGSLNMLGIRNRYQTPAVPFAVHHMVIVFELEGEHDDIEEEREFQMQLIDPDGHPMISGTGRVSFPGPGMTVNQFHGLQNQQFHSAGRHELNIWIEGTLAHSQPIDVHVVPPPETASPS